MCAEILPWKVAEFLVFSETFPRSIRYCLDRLDESLDHICQAGRRNIGSEVEKGFDRLRSDLATLSIEEIIEQGLHEYLTGIQETLHRVGQYLFEHFLDHPPIDMAAEIRIHQQEQQQQQPRKAGTKGSKSETRNKSNKPAQDLALPRFGRLNPASSRNTGDVNGDGRLLLPADWRVRARPAPESSHPL